MGKYTIELNLVESIESIRVNGTKPRRDYVHPHVSGGRCCFGTYADKIASQWAEDKYFDVLNTMHDFLSSCYPSGWYYPIYAWMQDLVEVCEHCDYHVDDCRCERDEERYYCDNCDADISHESCDCVRCPDNNDVLENSEFPDGQCAECNHLHKDLDNGVWYCGYDSGFECDIDYYEPPANRADRHNYMIIENNQTRRVRNAH
jgi:hypothetical protein